MSKPSPDFYVGYESQAPQGLAHFLKGRVALFLAAALFAGAVLAATQMPFSKAAFEFGELRAFDGWIEEHPFPTLVVERPGGGSSRYLLTAFGKQGAEHRVRGWNGKQVKLEGTLIYRDNMTMVELSDQEIQVSGDAPLPEAPAPRDGLALGTGVPTTLVGEIVDSKCYLGVMKPGNLKPHRACATRCISGGVPPVLLVRDKDGLARYYLLTGADGSSVNRAVVEQQLIAEPLRITGQVQQWGEQFVLRADPTTYERLP